MTHYSKNDRVRVTATNEIAFVRAVYSVNDEPQMLDLEFIDRTLARIPASDVSPFTTESAS